MCIRDRNILGAYFRPRHLGVSRTFLCIRPENQHAVLPIYCGSSAGDGRAVRTGKGELNSIHTPAVLIHLLYAQLPALVWDINDRSELPLKLIGVQEREIAGSKVVPGDRQVLYNLINHRFVRLASLDAHFDCVGYIGFQSIIKLLRCIPRNAEFI